MNKLYTAVGRMQFKGRNKSVRCPMVILNNREYILDIQEMMVWSLLNWRILSEDEIHTLYERKAQETGCISHRPVSECMKRLVQRGLIAEGKGELGADALPYYSFFDASTQEEWQQRVDAILELSLYDTGVVPQYGDQLLTLSTCGVATVTTNSRFAVLAVKIN